MFQLQHYRDQLVFEPENEFYLLHYIYHLMSWIDGYTILSSIADKIVNATTQSTITKVEDEPVLQENVLEGVYFMHIAAMLCEKFIIEIPFNDTLNTDDRHFAMMQRRKCCRMLPFYINTQDAWTAELDCSFMERFRNESSLFFVDRAIWKDSV